jgi:peptide chain release factor 2
MLYLGRGRIHFVTAFAMNGRALISSSRRVHDSSHNSMISLSTFESRLFSSKSKKDETSSVVSFDQKLLDTKRIVDQAMELHMKNLQSYTNPAQLQALIASLEREQASPDFYESNSDRATLVNQEIAQYAKQLSRLEQWNTWKEDCLAALEMIQDGEAVSTEEERELLLSELSSTVQLLLQDSERFALELLLSGRYDDAPARVVITAGAGGTEANDFVSMLYRMYERAATNMGFSVKIEDTQDGDVVGYKSVELLITGTNAFGMLQGEKGAHRLVRLSPFNSNNKRQTTFAGVDVAPDVMNEDDLKDIDIPDGDLEITAMRSGGKGGQNTNKVSSAVRIKHLPSGLQVKCTQERSQPLNKQIALKRLKAQLLAIAQEQRVQKIQEIRGDLVEASWGMQIRNYVLHPYKMVKDQRTSWETTNAQAFLDGDLLDDCIASYLRWKAEQENE